MCYPICGPCPPERYYRCKGNVDSEAFGDGLWFPHKLLLPVWHGDEDWGACTSAWVGSSRNADNTHHSGSVISGQIEHWKAHVCVRNFYSAFYAFLAMSASSIVSVREESVPKLCVEGDLVNIQQKIFSKQTARTSIKLESYAKQSENQPEPPVYEARVG